MKVGISTAPLYGKLYTEQALELFAQNGVACAEVFLASFSEYKEAFGRELQRVKGDVEVYSLHTLNSQFEGQLFSRSPRQYADALEIFTSALRVGNMLGAAIYVMHGPAQMKYTKYVTDYAFFGQRSAELAAISQQYGMMLTWENVHWAHYNHPMFMQNIRRHTGGVYLGNTLDIKQAAQSGTTVDAYIKDMDGNIQNIHVVDMDEDGNLVLPGRGCYDFKALFQKIGEYNGAVMIEVYDGCYRETAELIESYQWLKKQLCGSL